MLGPQYSRALVLCPAHPLLVLPPSSGTPDCYEGTLVLIMKSTQRCLCTAPSFGVASVISSSSQPPSEVCTRNYFIVEETKVRGRDESQVTFPQFTAFRDRSDLREVTRQLGASYQSGSCGSWCSHHGTQAGEVLSRKAEWEAACPRGL